MKKCNDFDAEEHSSRRNDDHGCDYKLNSATIIMTVTTTKKKEFEVNTQQVLAVLALTGKPLRLHRPSRCASCLLEWVTDSMADT